MTVGLRWDNKILPSGHGNSKKYPSGLCEITKNYPLDYVRLHKKYIWDFPSRLQKMLEITNILHSCYSGITWLQWDYIFVVKINLG